MRSIPDAIPQSPACGACGDETRHDDDFICEGCQLGFDPYTLEAFFLDPDASVCGAECGNYWHGDHKIKPGRGYDCGTCALPSRHESQHWTNCRPTTLGASA